MLKFIHVYNERFLKGLEKRGFLNDNMGLKLMHNFPIPENEKFNAAAAAGSKLYNLIKKNKYMFYIDRLQGGTFYHKYSFDRSLINEYSEMLGKDFLGIQIHEMGTVLNLDWFRIKKQMGDTPLPWSPKQIHDAILKVSACKWCIHLSCGTAEEYSEKTFPETWQDYSKAMEELFLKRQQETGGYLLPCNSHVMTTGMEYRLGAHTVMPEVGAQTPLLRLQVAIARGMSKAFGSLWGTYYEPWGGKPFSAPNYFEEKFNEWHLDNTIFPYDFTSNGPGGGSSRLLQSRIYYYSLMSGADYLSEEWGMTNTFYNWNDYELTPYGKIKKEFIDFSQKIGDVEAYIPFAIVLPRSFEAVDMKYITDASCNEYLRRPLEDNFKKEFGHIKNVLRLIYCRNCEIYGNEGHAITNSRFGDFFDVIFDDLNPDVYKKYDYLIDTTPRNRFSKSDVAQGLKVIDTSDIEKLAYNLDSILEQILPCTVTGGLHWMLSRTSRTSKPSGSSNSRGKWILSIFNNEGVDRSVEKGDYLIKEADRKIEIKFKQPINQLNVIHSVNADANIERKSENVINTTVGAGGFLILEFI